MIVTYLQKIKICIAVCTVLLFSISSLVFSRSDITNPPSIDLIRTDLDNKKISLDEYVIFIVNAIKNPSALPLEYKNLSLSTSVTPSQCLTPELIYIKNNWNLLAPATQQTYLSSMTPSATEFSIVTASGFFRFHYDTTGTDAVSPVDNDANSIPDYVDKCMAYMDTTLQVHRDLGYYDPPADNGYGGDYLYDVYFESMGYYGYMQPLSPGPQPWYDYTSYLVLHNNFSGFPSNDDPEGDVAGAAKATAAHEFHHAVQIAYNAGVPLWMLESDATYMEDIVFDQVNDNYNYMSSFFNQPHVSILENNSHAYSCFVWEMYLAEKFDTSLCVAMWEGARYSDIFTTLQDTLGGRYGWTLDSAFAEFANWNFTTNTRDDGNHYGEGTGYLPVAINRSHSGYPVNSTSPTAKPAGYAATYIRFYPDQGGTLTINFNGVDSIDWSANIIISASINNHTFDKISLNPVTKSGSIVIDNFENYYSVTLVGVNISENTSAASFSYSAYVTIPYNVAASLVNTDTLIYSGSGRTLVVNVVNNAPASDIISLVSWDDYGWVVTDSQAVALTSGQNTDLNVNLLLPQGTPLGQISNVFFKAISWGNPAVTDSTTARATSILQRGDADFSGFIDISDITYLVEYLFNGGPSPTPLLDAGDFNCTFDLGISDLTAIVSYMFQAGPKPPCNPY